MTILKRNLNLKPTVCILVLTILVINTSVYSQADSTKNWRLFPSLNDSNSKTSVDTNHTIADSLDFNQPDGTVTINGDEKINSLNSSLSKKPHMYGYTIQVAVSQQKKIIQDARYRMIKMHPGIALDDPYIEPNIYLYAGRFYDRNSAYEFKHKISKQFPNAIVIGPKKMKLPIIEMPLATEKEAATPNR